MRPVRTSTDPRRSSRRARSCRHRPPNLRGISPVTWPVLVLERQEPGFSLEADELQDVGEPEILDRPDEGHPVRGPASWRSPRYRRTRRRPPTGARARRPHRRCRRPGCDPACSAARESNAQAEQALEGRQRLGSRRSRREARASTRPQPDPRSPSQDVRDAPGRIARGDPAPSPSPRRVPFEPRRASCS